MPASEELPSAEETVVVEEAMAVEELPSEEETLVADEPPAAESGGSAS